MFGLLAVMSVNAGFWIGSLWGDDPGAGWTRAPAAAPGGRPWMVIAEGLLAVAIASPPWRCNQARARAAG